MSDLPAAQQQALETWASNAIDAGWLARDASASIQNAVIAEPGQLFDVENRPLVVGLFGGTGVGKSTLLNRFAGDDIAHASAERPTSRDITVYVHQSVSVDKLPENFPMHKMRTSTHANPTYRHVMFIDMPDFDSVEVANRDLVDIWLPHLDVVLYVVSPDRYRDDQGWRLLTTHAKQHAWMFVMNHWDRGDAAQLEDFRSQLAAAGLENPVIYHTDSSPEPAEGADQFNALQLAIQETADQSIIQSLEELGIVARLKAMKSISDPWLEKLPDGQVFSTLQKNWAEHWNDYTETLSHSLQPNIEQFASHYQDPQGFLARRFGGTAPSSIEIPALSSLVNESTLTRLDNGLADFINQQSQRLNVPVAAMKQEIAAPYSRARAKLETSISAELQSALANPGNVFQRSLHKALGVIALLLPLACMGWVSYRAVQGFVEGGSNPAAYLGSNFAVNAVLIVALSWAIPTFLHRKSRPSRQRAAVKGLTSGFNVAFSELETAVADSLALLTQRADTLRTQYRELWQTLAAPDTARLPEPVRRMLASEVTSPVQRSLDVRANTQSSTDDAPVS